MEDNKITFNTVCRVCLSHDRTENMVSLLDNINENGLSSYGKSFEILTKIPVKQNDYLPMNICLKCKKSLEEFASFTSTSESSDRNLLKLINFSEKHDLSGDMIQEVVLQYTLFNHQFPDECDSCSSSTSNVVTHTNIKVRIDLQKQSLNGAITENIYQSNDNDKILTNTGNVDIFLNSIETLLTAKVHQKDKPVKNINQSKTEVKIKESEPDLTCNVCYRTLANSATYKNHMQRHGICRYVCDHCGKGFPVLAELTQHQIYRHGIGSTLECDQCSFKAARKLELIEHIRLHTGERPFTCEKCGLTFRRKAIYKNHLKSHGERNVPCDYCPRKFYRRCEMLAHSNNIHDRVYAFLCKICNVTYAMAKTVRRHMLVKHGIPLHMQGKVVRINKDNDLTFFKARKNNDVEYNNL